MEDEVTCLEEEKKLLKVCLNMLTMNLTATFVCVRLNVHKHHSVWLSFIER